MYRTKRISGFTLAELLVVISIIGILSAITMVSVNKVRMNSRDKARVADIAQIQLALKLYQTQNGHYPREGDGFSGVGAPGRICASCDGPINDVIRQYMGSVPEDPKHDGSNYYYYYDGSVACGGSTNKSIIFAYAMETDKYKNKGDFVCSSWGTEGGVKRNAYIVQLGESSG